LPEYRIVVYEQIEHLWQKKFAIHGEAADENTALQRAASARNAHPAFQENEVDEKATIWRNPDPQQVHYPNLVVDLEGLGMKYTNPFQVIGKVRFVMKHAGVPMKEIGIFSREATGAGIDKKVNTFEETMNVIYSWVTVRS
jgi:hypothetical protein